jgi:hypothetical protein
MKPKTTPQEILAFISAARRMPDNELKEIWVRWLVQQYEQAVERTSKDSDSISR